MSNILFSCENEALASLLQLHCEELGFCPKHPLTVTVTRGDALTVVKENKQLLHVTYTRDCELFRALTHLNAVLHSAGDVREEANYSFLCYMADCSRNAVMTVDTAKQLIRYLARMGYNAMMLYTEDTYEIDGYDYFGHMRGRYKKSELKELDAYAALHGIELIPCIQTLGHLERIFHYPAMQSMCDDRGVLLAEDEAVYRFIEAELDACRECFRTNKIHVGMDEAHTLGRGRYLDKHGYKKPSEIMLAHLEKVCELSKARGFAPMIWSDMFFHMQFGRYTVSQGEISPEVIAKVPKEVALVYWEYYGCEPHMFDCHHQFGNDTYYAGGAIKWMGYCAHNTYCIETMRHALDTCQEKGVDKIIVTGWGDHGADASQFSVLPTLLYFAERCYGTTTDRRKMNLRSEACFGVNFRFLCAFDYPDNLFQEPKETRSWAPNTPTKYLLFNDPLLGLFDRHIPDADEMEQRYEQAAGWLATTYQCMESHPFRYALRTLEALSRVMMKKATLGVRLRAAYQAGDRAALLTISQSLPVLIADLYTFSEAFEAQWMKENKPFGLEVQQNRIGGLIHRIRSLKERLDGYLAGECASIDELEEKVLPFWPERDGKFLVHQFSWFEAVSPSALT